MFLQILNFPFLNTSLLYIEKVCYIFGRMHISECEKEIKLIEVHLNKL